MIDEFLTKRATVARAPQPTAALSGSAKRVHATLATNVPFAVWAKSGSFRQNEAGKEIETTHGGATHYAIQTGDRITTEGVTYEVTFVSRPQNAFYSCELARVV